MPRLSDTMEEGAVSVWRKKPGDAVAVGDVLVEIETDKAVMEYEAYQAGTLAKILVPEGENAEIGAPIALLDDGSGAAAGSPGDQNPPAERAVVTPDTPASSPTVATAPAAGTPAATNGARQLASPLVRKLARENHLDLSQVKGSGPGGRIIRADISGLLARGTAAPAAEVPLPAPAPAVPAEPAAAAAKPAAAASVAGEPADEVRGSRT